MYWQNIDNKDPYYILEILSMKEPPFNSFDIAKSLKINISNILDYKKLIYEGEIYINEMNEPEVWINPIKGVSRQRFALAYALWHVLHSSLNNVNNLSITIEYDILYSGNKNYILKNKDNDFARKLLMPQELLEKFINKCRQKNPNLMAIEAIKKISSKFEVPEKAVVLRLLLLGLIDKDYRYLF